jgi:hypothetical protein
MSARTPTGLFVAKSTNPAGGLQRLVRSHGSFSEWNDTVRRRLLDRSAPLKWAAYLVLKRSFEAVALRFWLAISGGAVLIVPVILMSYFTSREACLIITSVWVIAFSVFFSVFTSASKEAVMGTAAAYAAVLVVFVGNALAGNTHATQQ